MWSEEEMTRRFGFIIEAIIRFFKWIPAWLLAIIAFPCFVGTALTSVIIGPEHMATWQLLATAAASVIGMITGAAWFIKTN